MTEKEMIAAFIKQMREHHEAEISGINLPEGTLEYVEERIAAGDAETLLFMLKLGYLMGLQTGFAASQAGEIAPSGNTPFGPLQA